MKRLWITLPAIAMALVIALPAGAGKPEKPDKPSPEPPTAKVCESVTTLDGVTELECDWTPAHDQNSGNGTVTVTVGSGAIGGLAIFVRDSAPGDICVLEQWSRPIGTVFTAEFPLVNDGDESYWDEETHWCAQFDPIVGEREDLNGNPLHVAVNLRAKKGTVVEVSLSPGQATS